MSEDNSTVILAKEGSRRQVQYLNKSCAEWVRWKINWVYGEKRYLGGAGGKAELN